MNGDCRGCSMQERVMQQGRQLPPTQPSFVTWAIVEGRSGAGRPLWVLREVAPWLPKEAPPQRTSPFLSQGILRIDLSAARSCLRGAQKGNQALPRPSCVCCSAVWGAAAVTCVTGSPWRVCSPILLLAPRVTVCPPALPAHLGGDLGWHLSGHVYKHLFSLEIPLILYFFSISWNSMSPNVRFDAALFRRDVSMWCLDSFLSVMSGWHFKVLSGPAQAGKPLSVGFFSFFFTWVCFS